MPTKSSTPKFRKAVSILKQQGIIDSKTDTKNARPFWIRNGKRLDELVNKYDDVISGKAKLVKSTDVKKQYRKIYESKREGKNTYLLVPHSATEKVTIKNKDVVYRNAAGIDRIQIPVEYHNLEQWLQDAQHEKYLKEGYNGFGFRFFGGYSQFYYNIDQLWEEFQKYESISEALSGSRQSQREMYRNFELLRVNKQQWFKDKKSSKSKRKSTKSRRRKKK